MASNYPGGLDDFETIPTDVEMNATVGGRTHRDMHNDMGDAIESIEGELGVNPAGIYDTVAERLAAVDDRVLDGTISDIDIASDADIDRSKIAGTALTQASTGVFSVLDYGADPTGVADAAAAIQAAAAALTAAGSGTLLFPAGDYLIDSLAEGDALVTFTSLSGVTVDASQATLTNPTSYTADDMTILFGFNACTDVTVKIKHFIGYTLPTPETYIGYRGMTVVNLANACNGVKVDARITNCRYGVRAGNYSLPAQGNSNNLDLKIRGEMIGYPCALYLSDNVTCDIDVDGMHRAAYFAGCDNVRGVAAWRDQYVADTAVLLTDSIITAEGIAPTDPSKGCSNFDFASIDKGSTVNLINTICIGITLQRVQPMVHENLNLRFSSTTNDTISTKVGGFRIQSSSKAATTPAASYNWESYVVLRNITVSGVLDHTGQTANGNGAGDIFIRTYDTTAAHAATVQNLVLRDISIPVKSPGTRYCEVIVPGATGVVLDSVQAPTSHWSVISSLTVPAQIRNSSLGRLNNLSTLLSGVPAISLDGSSITDVYDYGISDISTTGFHHLSNSKVSGAGYAIRHKRTVLTALGASVSWTAAIPAGALVLGVHARVATNLSNGSTSGFQVGVAGDADRYADKSGTAAGTATGPADVAADSVAPIVYKAATDLVLTAKDSDFTVGTVLLVLTYLEFSAPTG